MFTINFTQPWLLLLLIPAVGLTVLNYFLVYKRYRNTRNRIISIVAHTLVMLLAITVLAGITFEYDVRNDSNEMLVLVDMSDTQPEISADRELYLKELLNEAQYDNIKVGLVKFGFDQVYAAPMTYDTPKAYDQFVNAPQPDTGATDIAAAINYAVMLFEHPTTAKILILSDGLETDENAVEAVRNAALKGIKVDATRLDSNYKDDSIQISAVETPNYYVRVNQQCQVNVTVNSKADSNLDGVRVELFDNGRSVGVQEDAVISAGEQSVSFNEVVFGSEGLHELRAEISYNGEDKDEKNNAYCAYYYIQVHDSMLVLEHRNGDSDSLVRMIDEQFGKDVKVINVTTDPDVPTSVEELCGYDQVVLNNVSNADLGDELADLLYTYVYENGGSVFTVGGDNDDDSAHAYNRKDLYGSKLQEMLPVEAVNYRPPMGVVLIVDDSGSMQQNDRLPAAKAGAYGCLEVLDDSDYVGVMTFSNTYTYETTLISCVYDTQIKNAIDSLGGGGGGTYFRPALEAAAKALKAESRINRRHIVFVTDCQVFDVDDVVELAKNENYSDITVSVVGIEPDTGDFNAMNKVAEAWGGTAQTARGTGETLKNRVMDLMKDDLKSPDINEYKEEEFNPEISAPGSPIVVGVEHGLGGRAWALSTTLGGYYGVRAKTDAEVILTGPYEVPLYAQWQFGAGRVGSFMCDLYGKWSAGFLQDDNCVRLLCNAMTNIMPLTDIEVTGVKISVSESNYINTLYVAADLKEGESLSGRIEYADESGKHSVTLNEVGQDGDVYVKSELGNNKRAVFVIKRTGAYKIIVDKLDEDGNVLGSSETYKAFAFSKEYDLFNDADPYLLENLAREGGGKMVDIAAPLESLSNFVVDIHNVYDPRLALIITAMVLFLLDIWVRKFKFRWPHEIIKARKAKKGGK